MLLRTPLDTGGEVNTLSLDEPHNLFVSLVFSLDYLA